MNQTQIILRFFFPLPARRSTHTAAQSRVIYGAQSIWIIIFEGAHNENRLWLGWADWNFLTPSAPNSFGRQFHVLFPLPPRVTSKI